MCKLQTCKTQPDVEEDVEEVAVVEFQVSDSDGNQGYGTMSKDLSCKVYTVTKSIILLKFKLRCIPCGSYYAAIFSEGADDLYDKKFKTFTVSQYSSFLRNWRLSAFADVIIQMISL